MEWLIRAPDIETEQQPEADSVQMVRVEPPKEQPQDAAAKLPDLAPPPPPAAPPSLARPALPAIAAPAISIAPATVDVAVTGTPVNLGSSLGLSSFGAFGGFAGGGGNGSGGGGTGNGQGGGGFARGQGFSGKELIPLSTARPQMPDWACKQKIKGWVEVVFVVNTNGTVENVRIVDAQPRGVFEAAAIQSVSHWIYPRSKEAQEVKQRVPMDPEDCAYNYGQ